MEPRILVVDDDNLIRRIMRDTLVTIPATVLEATNVEEAIRIAQPPPQPGPPVPGATPVPPPPPEPPIRGIKPALP